MPLYTFSKDGEEQEIHCKMDELEEVTNSLKEEGWVRTYKPLNIVSQAGSTLSKTDNGWKEVLGRIKKGSGRNNTIKL